MEQQLATVISPEVSLAATISQVRADLERAVKFDTVKAIRDQAEALRAYAKSIGAARTAFNSIAEIKIRAERRMGREIARFELNTGGRPSKTGDTRSPVSAPTLSELGIHKKWSQRWQILARMPSPEFEAYLVAVKRSGEELTAAGAYRAARMLQQASTSPAANAHDLANIRRQLRALERAWAGASDAARRAFIEKHASLSPASQRGEENGVLLMAAR